jgi:diaminopimelate decarboxylase
MKLPLFPQKTTLTPDGHLLLNGQRAADLVAQFGTPLYVYDLDTIRRQIAAYRAALATYPGQTRLTYASKAFLCPALAEFMQREGVGLDVASAGEIYIAQQGGADPAQMHLHGNNKTRLDVETALQAGVGRIVVDNQAELDLLSHLATERQQAVNIWLRVTPGVPIETHHRYTVTGSTDSKFGFPLDQAQAVAEHLLQQPTEQENKKRDTPGRTPPSSTLHPPSSPSSTPTPPPSQPSHPPHYPISQSPREASNLPISPFLHLTGLHLHLGSHFHDVEPVAIAIERLLDLAQSLHEKYGWTLHELCPGGGWGVRYHPDDQTLPIEQFVTGLVAALVEQCRRRNLALPTLILEPGRSLVAQAGVALYTVGSRKVIPNVRTYVSVDGGLADNPRPALYQARYTALLANRATEPESETVAIAGPFCESGDVMIEAVALPVAEPGDILAVPVAGAYHLSMSSNYNAALRPAVLFNDGGQVKLVQRRETLADLVRRDV